MREVEPTRRTYFRLYNEPQPVKRWRVYTVDEAGKPAKTVGEVQSTYDGLANALTEKFGATYAKEPLTINELVED